MSPALARSHAYAINRALIHLHTSHKYYLTRNNAKTWTCFFSFRRSTNKSRDVFMCRVLHHVREQRPYCLLAFRRRSYPKTIEMSNSRALENNTRRQHRTTHVPVQCYLAYIARRAVFFFHSPTRASRGRSSLTIRTTRNVTTQIRFFSSTLRAKKNLRVFTKLQPTIVSRFCQIQNGLIVHRWLVRNDTRANDNRNVLETIFTNLSTF